MTAAARAMEYATPQDFCAYFLSHTTDLFQLAFLLAGTEEDAEDSFVAALEECTEGNAVFREWTGCWARRAIIKQAVARTLFGHGRKGERRNVLRDPESLPKLDASLLPVVRLAPLDRFAFVLTVLERLSETESAILLGCSVREVVRARERAFTGIAGNPPKAALLDRSRPQPCPSLHAFAEA